MRVLLWLVLFLGLGWGGYWFAGSRALEAAADRWFADQSAAGMIAEREGLSVNGFPSRFDLTVTEPRLEDPETGWGWSAPFVQVLTLSYTPWHWIAAFAPEQQIDTPSQRFQLTSDKLQGSLSVTPNTDLALDQMRLVGDRLSLASTLGWTVAAETLRLATRQGAPGGTEHEVGIEVLNIAPDPAIHAELPDLPETIERFHLDARLTFSAPLDRRSAGAAPGLVAVDLGEMQLTWGDFAIFGKGRVTADAGGLAEGRIDLRLTNWRRLLPVAIALGAVTPEVAPTWENMLSLLAAQSGDPDDLDLPLTFRRGRMSLGPLPLGPAPRMN